MEVAIVTLSFALLILSIMLGVCCLTIPYLYRELVKTRSDLEKLDEVVSNLLEAAGLEPSGNNRVGPNGGRIER